MAKKIEHYENTDWETDDEIEEEVKNPDQKKKKKKSKKKSGKGLLVALLIVFLVLLLLAAAAVFLLRSGKLNVLLGKTIQYNGDEDVQKVAETIAGRLNAAGGKYTITKAETSQQDNYTYYPLKGRSGSWILIPDAVVNANGGTGFVDKIIANAFSVKTIVPEMTYVGLVEGESAVVNIECGPETAFDTEVVWSSADESVAVVDEYGNITGLTYGDTSVTVTANSGAFAAIAVHVDALPESIEMQETAEMGVGETLALTAEVLPVHAVRNELTWSSSDATVVEVNSNGSITAVSGGEAVITCETVNGLEASCTVHVSTTATGIKLSHTEITLQKGETFALEASPIPENAVDGELTFSVSDEEILALEEDNTVTALKPGTASIIVTCGDDITAECAVTVEYVSEGVEITKVSKKYKNPWLKMTVHTTMDVQKVALYYVNSGELYMTDYEPTLSDDGTEYLWYVKYPVSEHGGYARFKIVAYGENDTDTVKFTYKVPVLH